MEKEKHYDGSNPEEPLPPDHFTDAEREDARQLGDGSPAIDARESGEAPETPATSTRPEKAG